MYYQMEDDNRTFDSAEEIVNYLCTPEYFMEDSDGFCEYLDESEGNVEVCGYDWPASEVLETMNRDAFEREFEYWAENQADDCKQDYVYELERLSHGQHMYICGYEVYAYDDDSEDGEDTDGDEEVSAVALKLLELKLTKEKEDKANEMTEREKTANDFLSVLGIQVI